ncbi:MAG: DUF4367 domain-containing protein [Christensenellales bacterium]
MNKSEYQDDQKLRAEYQKVLISKAMREIRDEEADSLLECSPEDQRYLEFLETNREKRMEKMMRRLRWISLKKQFFTVVPRTMRFAVAALGILCIGLTTAFASSETFRVRVFSMFAEDHGQYTAIGLREDEQKAFDVPNGWEGMYYPTYIPDGFEVISVENLSEQIFLISFENKNNEYLTFEEMTEDAESNIDTENARVYYTEIHGNTALVSVKADLTIVSWNEQNRILSVVFDGEVEEDALKVAKSVTRIK